MATAATGTQPRNDVATIANASAMEMPVTIARRCTLPRRPSRYLVLRNATSMKPSATRRDAGGARTGAARNRAAVGYVRNSHVTANRIGRPMSKRTAWIRRGEQTEEDARDRRGARVAERTPVGEKPRR